MQPVKKISQYEVDPMGRVPAHGAKARTGGDPPKKAHERAVGFREEWVSMSQEKQTAGTGHSTIELHGLRDIEKQSVATAVVKAHGSDVQATIADVFARVFTDFLVLEEKSQFSLIPGKLAVQNIDDLVPLPATNPPSPGTTDENGSMRLYPGTSSLSPTSMPGLSPCPYSIISHPCH
ncbi:hypothetical protein NM688_g1752 [Phlebia brevispora]|uniref:Uncharacterized protein n=1 Tax=Phlebia brevispora TaxID=194682 RepID=A0ACC1TAW9_9APHY|nr:hypothetical protein NM688_g1752 [Phlebia brevispora]